MTQLLHPVIEQSLDGVQHFVLDDANWGLYERLVKTVGDRPIRITYDDGRLEIISPLPSMKGRSELLGE